MRRSFVQRISNLSHPAAGAEAEIDVYLELADAALMVLDPDAVVLRVNRQACAVFGRTAEELIGRTWTSLVAVAGADADAEGRVRSRVSRSDGTEREVEWRLATRTDAEDRVVAVVASGQDVTETVEAQQQLAALRRLAQTVAAEDDARQALVEQGAELTGAEHVLLTEAGLVTAVSHPAPPDPNLALVAAVVQHGEAREDDRTRYEPVVLQGVTIAVLVFTWARPPVPAHVLGLVGLVADETTVALRRLAALRSLEEAALEDSLTGVPNRRAFDLELPRALGRARRSGELAVAMMDLNDFKELNDRSGHEAGDRVLKATGAAWQAQLRSTDMLARLGGDEFVAVLPDCSADEAPLVVRRLREAVTHPGGASVGLVHWDGAEDLSELMRRADRALYADKARSKRSRLARPERLAALQRTGLLDGSTDPRLDEITHNARWLLEAPVALVSLVDDRQQVFASQCGLTGWAAEDGRTPLTHSFCQHAVATGRPLVIEDARVDDLVRHNGAVEDLDVVAYAGIPLQSPEGEVLGVLCVIDHEPRRWSEDDLSILRRLAARTEDVLAERLSADASRDRSGG